MVKGCWYQLPDFFKQDAFLLIVAHKRLKGKLYLAQLNNGLRSLVFVWHVVHRLWTAKFLGKPGKKQERARHAPTDMKSVGAWSLL